MSVFDIVTAILLIGYMFLLIEKAKKRLEEGVISEFAYNTALFVFIGRYVVARWIAQGYGLTNLPQNDWLFNLATCDQVVFLVSFLVAGTFCWTVADNRNPFMQKNDLIAVRVQTEEKDERNNS